MSSENWNQDESAVVGVGLAAATGNWMQAATLGLSFIYHRFFEPPPPPPPPSHAVAIPRVDAGAPYPLLFGTCRVRQPVLAYASAIENLETNEGDGISGLYPAPTTNSYLYFMDMLFVLGIPMDGGCTLGPPPPPEGSFPTNPPSGVYWGDTMMTSNFPVGSLRGDGGPEDTTGPNGVCQLQIIQSDGSSAEVGGALEFLNGAGTGGTPSSSNQKLVNTSSPYAYTTRAGQYMTTTTNTYPNIVLDLVGTLSGEYIPGYRGLACAFLYGNTPGTGSNPPLLHWLVGRQASVPSVSFTVNSTGALGTSPMAAIYDILTSTNGKLGISTSRIDVAAFQAVCTTLNNEGNVYWRSIESITSVDALFQEMLSQADGGLYEDPVTGLITPWLARNDYDPVNLQRIWPSSTVELRNFALSGWTDIINKIRLQFTNSDDDFRPGFAIAQNDTNALVQSDVRQAMIQMPGCPNQVLANFLAARELAARSRPLIKCQATMDREFFLGQADTRPGDVLLMVWPEYGISNIPMRVVGMDVGSLGSQRVVLDLVQDYFSVFQMQPPTQTTIIKVPFPGGGLIGP